MTNEEALTELKIEREVMIMANGKRMRLDEPPMDFNKDIEVYGVAISAVEKQIPKKPIRYVTNFPGCCRVSKCPTCGQEFGFNVGFNFCDNCGQAIDWSKE